MCCPSSARVFHVGLDSKRHTNSLCLEFRYVCVYSCVYKDQPHVTSLPWWNTNICWSLLTTPKAKEAKPAAKIRKRFWKGWISHLFASWITDVCYLSFLCNRDDCCCCCCSSVGWDALTMPGQRENTASFLMKPWGLAASSGSSIINMTLLCLFLLHDIDI